MPHIVAAVGAVAAVAALIPVFVPDATPCPGDTDAEFTDARVFPQVRFHDHLIRNGVKKEALAAEPNLRGAEIRFSYRTTGYRDSTLTITWSLIAIDRDDTDGAVVPGHDRAVAMSFTPDACSESGGNDLFIPSPEPGKRYRVVLELYRDRDPDLGERIAFTQTDPFRG